MTDYDKIYSIYKVKRILLATGSVTPMIITTSKEKAKLEAVKLFAENYGMIHGQLMQITVTEYTIECASVKEYWDAMVNDHRSFEPTAVILLHNAEIDNRIQNEYTILSSDMLLKI